LWVACGLPLNELDTNANITRQLAYNLGLSFVAVQGDRLVGTVLGTFDGRRGWVHHLAVSENYRHVGLGKRLMARVEDAFRARGVTLASLMVAEDNGAVVPFYEKLGWHVRTGATPMFKSL
jgi:ribosomal protein S18 acetylase RimI-like enzyme